MISWHPSLRGLHFLPENNYDLVGTAHPTMCHAGVFVGWAVPTKKRINFRKSVNYFCGDMKDAIISLQINFIVIVFFIDRLIKLMNKHL